LSQAKISQNCSWSWRELLKTRLVARRFLQHKVGDGGVAFFCGMSGGTRMGL